MDIEKLKLLTNDLRSALRIKRKKQRKSLVDLGKETGISYNYLGLWERGDSDITVSKFIKIVYALDALDEVHLCLKSGM